MTAGADGLRTSIRCASLPSPLSVRRTRSTAASFAGWSTARPYSTRVPSSRVNSRLSRLRALTPVTSRSSSGSMPPRAVGALASSLPGGRRLPGRRPAGRGTLATYGSPGGRAVAESSTVPSAATSQNRAPAETLATAGRPGTVTWGRGGGGGGGGGGGPGGGGQQEQGAGGAAAGRRPLGDGDVEAGGIVAGHLD